MTRALVVDDERHVAKLLEYMLRKNGYEVTVAYDGDEALRKVQEFKPDVVLLDMVLPGLSGAEVLEQIRADEKNYKIVVLVLTGHAFDVASDSSGQSSADAYCTKPVAPSTLLNRLCELGVGPDR
jgi:DNA-binding response OmpR family regulator